MRNLDVGLDQTGRDRISVSPQRHQRIRRDNPFDLHRRREPGRRQTEQRFAGSHFDNSVTVTKP